MTPDTPPWSRALSGSPFATLLLGRPLKLSQAVPCTDTHVLGPRSSQGFCNWWRFWLRVDNMQESSDSRCTRMRLFNSSDFPSFGGFRSHRNDVYVCQGGGWGWRGSHRGPPGCSRVSSSLLRQDPCVTGTGGRSKYCFVVTVVSTISGSSFLFSCDYY